MLGNESLREAFAIGPPSDEVAREYLYWLRHTRRRTALTVYQYAGKLESFLAWIDHDSLSNVDNHNRRGPYSEFISGSSFTHDSDALGRGRGDPGASWLEERQYGDVDEDLASRLRTAFNERDIDVLRSLLAEDATWGEDPATWGEESDGGSFCRGRNDIIRHVKQLLDQGVRATIVETTTGRHGIAVRLHVDWPDPEDDRPESETIYQAYMVTDGLVTEIHGHDDQEAALTAISG